jgi:hypothetical protein
MLDYLAYMESVRRMRESLRDGQRADLWQGMPARPQPEDGGRLRHGMALALRDVAARLDPVPA